MRNDRLLRAIVAVLSILCASAPFPLRAATAAPAPRPTRLQPRQEAPSVPDEPQPEAEQKAREALTELPMVFEENRGQTDARAKYLARGRGYTLFLTDDGAVLSLTAPIAPDSDASTHEQRARRAAIRLGFSGANPRASAAGEEALESRSNYMIGADQSKWQTDVPNFARVRYEGLYPGIDAVYYGADGQMEYDFVVAPGASPDAIRMTIDGVDRITIDDSGDLVLAVADKTIRQRRPSLYQAGPDGAREPVSGGYRTDGARDVWFSVGEYDRSRPLVIDPVLLYSTFLGGSATNVFPDDRASAIVVVGQTAIVAGVTTSADFPTTGSAYARASKGAFDVFVAGLSTDGSTLTFSTYLGGTLNDTAGDVAVDAAGAIYVTGSTASTDFPRSASALDSTYNGGSSDAFVTKLSPGGTALNFSTLLGGSGADTPFGVAFDGAGAAYVAGQTSSLNFPTTSMAVRTTFEGPSEAFVTKLDPTLGSLVYSTFLGGNGAGGEAANDITVDATNNAYVTGVTSSDTFTTTPGAFDRTFGGVNDAFVVRLATDGSSLGYSTFLGGASDDASAAVAVDGAGAAYVTGSTSSADFPATSGADTTLSGVSDAFVTKLLPNGSGLTFSTFLGGGGGENGTDVVVSSGGVPYVTGQTSSASPLVQFRFPTTSGAFRSFFNGGTIDSFVTVLNPTNGTLTYSTYLGGASDETANGIGIDTSGLIYVAGQVLGAGYPTTSSAYDPSYNQGFDAFVTKLDPASPNLVYSTFLGGISTASSDQAVDVAITSAGNAVVVGTTTSADFPVTVGAYDTTEAGSSDVTVTMINAAGSALVYSTYIGGFDLDTAFAVAVDSSGSAYVVGETFGSFPVTAGAFSTSFGGTFDGFVAKLSASGNQLLYATYLGASGADSPRGVAVDGSGSAYVVGVTTSSFFPVTPGAFQTASSGNDAFVTKLNGAGSALVYSGLLTSAGATDVALDATGAVFVTGRTFGAGFQTTSGAFDVSFNGGTVDAFVTKVSASGTSLVYSTYVGGTGDDIGNAIGVDATGMAYVAGSTTSSNFPVTGGAFDTSYNGATDAFVVRLPASGAAPLSYSTYLGGAGDDVAKGLVVRSDRTTILTGTTSSSNLPTTSTALDPTFNGGDDVFVASLDVAGATLGHATYIGGSNDEDATGIVITALGAVVVAGSTASFNFPTTASAFDTGLSGRDGFVFSYCIGDEPAPDIQTQPLNQTINRGQTATLSVAATSSSGFPLSYQWYRGESGFTSDPVVNTTSAMATFTTPVLQSTTRFWVRVSDACGVFRDSASALVTVNRAPVPVTTVADSGAGSLRAAITASNGDPGTDTITFNLAAPFTINVTSPLPNFTEAVILDGLTQPGSAAGRPIVVLAGPGAGAGQPDCANDAAASFDGLHFIDSAAGSVVRGLVVNGFPGDGIEFQGGGDAGHQSLVQSCFVGTNAAGTAAVMNGRHGVYLNNSAYAIVGGDRAPDGSLALGALLSGNHCAGVKIRGGLAANNTVIGSNIGPDVTGRFPIGNQIGIDIEGAPNTVVGAAGDDAGRRNVCGFNMGVGTATSGNINTKLGGTSPPNTVVLGTTFTNNGGGAIVGGAPYVLALTSAALSATTLSVAGSATVPANRQYRVQYFTSTTCSGSGGQGEVLIAANVLKQSSPAGVLDLGFASAATTARPGELVAVTVTGTEGTSNFSSCQIVTGRLSVVAERAGTVTLTSLAISGPGGAVEQGTPGVGSGGTPGLDRTFAGPRDPDDPDVTNDEVVPPDPQAAVGPNHLLAVTNEEIVVASKTDGTVARRVPLDAIWAGLKRMPSENLFAFNPRAVYDALGGRYVLAATANPRATNSAVLLAVSKTTDPLGQWNVYRYDAEGAEVLWADYPTLGFTKDWIAIQVNMSSIAFANVIVRSEIYLVDKAAAYAGSPGTGQASVLGRATTDGSFGATQMPAQTYDAAASTLWLAQTGAGNQGGVGTIQLYRVTGAVGSEVLATGPAFTTTSAWNTNQLPFADFAPQAGSARKLQINDTRMQAVVFRNGRVYCAHTILLPAVGPTRSAVQWWEVDPAGAGTLVQRGRIDSGTATEMEAHPSLAVSAAGAIVVGYSRFTTTTFPSAAYRYRVATDPAGTLRGEVVLKAGEAKYDKTLGGSDNRWGNYSSATVDPSDTNRFWLMNEYAETPRTGASATTDQWGVWWGSFAGATSVAGADTAGIYVASTGAWFLKNTNGGGSADLVFGFGPTGSTLVALRGDWNGDGIDTPGLYDPVTGNFFLKNTSGGGAADIVFTFGAGGTSVVPVVGDFDGNGTDTIGIYNRTTAAFFLKNTNGGGSADVVFSFGPGGADVEPLFGDYDGNGSDTVGIYNRTTGSWFLKNTNGGGSADLVFGFGPTGTGVEPLMGDYDGNGTDTVGVYITATGTWFLKNSNGGGGADLAFSFGPSNVMPLVGDWDGL